jgi:hypothetical protein
MVIDIDKDVAVIAQAQDVLMDYLEEYDWVFDRTATMYDPETEKPIMLVQVGQEDACCAER